MLTKLDNIGQKTFQNSLIYMLLTAPICCDYGTQWTPYHVMTHDNNWPYAFLPANSNDKTVQTEQKQN